MGIRDYLSTLWLDVIDTPHIAFAELWCRILGHRWRFDMVIVHADTQHVTVCWTCARCVTQRYVDRLFPKPPKRLSNGARWPERKEN